MTYQTKQTDVKEHAVSSQQKHAIKKSIKE